jgi:carboxymethylenebutenolidase
MDADPDVAVCYYGSGMPSLLDRREQIHCPVLFHFGGEDQYIPREQAELVETFAASRPNMECHIQDDGGHAFDNHEAPMFHQPEAAARARKLTKAFLARTLPG